jgi:hypothetical protein
VLVPEQREGLGGKLTLLGRECEVVRALGELGLALAERPFRLDVGEEQTGAIRIVRGDQVEGSLQKTDRGPRGVERERSLAGIGKRLLGRLAE